MTNTLKYILIFVLFFVWVALAALLTTPLMNDGGSRLGVLASLVLLQIVTLMAVAYLARLKPSKPAEDSEKLKRGSITDPDAKMRLLLEMMDDDERYAFKQAMKERMLSGSRDGELNYDADSLGALLDEDEYKRQRR